MTQHTTERRPSMRNIFSATRRKAHSTTSLNFGAMSVQSHVFRPVNSSSESVKSNAASPIPAQVINEPAASTIIHDRRTSIMNSMFVRMARLDVLQEDMEEKVQMQQRSPFSADLTNLELNKKRSKTIMTTHSSTRKGTVQINESESESDSDDDAIDDAIMNKVQREETIQQLRAEQQARKKGSTTSTYSVRTIASSKTQRKDPKTEGIVARKAREFLQTISQYIDCIGEWFKWRFFLWGPLICQLVCLWSCFPHHDAFFIVILIWSYLSLFLLHSSMSKRNVFDYGVVCILTYSICASFVKYISYIPSLYDSSNSVVFDYFGMKDYGDLNGSYMFVACIPFIVTSGYLKIQTLYRLISCERIVSYLTAKNRSKYVREMKRIAEKYPQNFAAIMSKRGGTILHCCVDFRNVDMIPIVAPFVNVNARDMYGRSALSQARRIYKHSQDPREKHQMTEIIGALWKAGCLRKKHMRWYSMLYQYIWMAGNYIAAAFYVMIEKLILLGVYVISTERADILHFLFLLFFLVFLWLGPLAHKYWRTLVLYNGFAVTLRYVFIVFDAHPIDMISNEFGFRPPSDTAGLIYPTILLSFVILNDHLARKRRERHMLLEFKFEQLILRNTAYRTHSFVFAILYYLFYFIQDWCLLLVYIALIAIGMVQIHAIHLGYCICVFFCFFFHCWFKDPWGKIRGYWILIVAYCAICFFGLYASQYSFIHDWLEDDVYPKTFNNKYFSLEDIGLTNHDTDNEEAFAMWNILLGPVIAMILTVIQFGYFVSNKPHQEVKRNYYVLKMSRFCCQILYLGHVHCEKVLLFASFLWCMYRVNLISMAYVLVGCVAVINRVTLRTAWCPFQLIAVMVFIMKYSYQYHYFQHRMPTENVNAQVIGFERFGTSVGDKPVDATTGQIWYGLGQELTIILLASLQCVLQWWIRLAAPEDAPLDEQKPVIAWRHERIYYEDFMRVKKREKSYSISFIGDDGNKSEPLLQQHNDTYDSLIHLQIEDDIVFNSSTDTYDTKVKKFGHRTMSHAQLSAALRYMHITFHIIIRCLWRTLRRFYHVLNNIFYFYGVEISVIMMVFTAFYRNYSFSCIYIMVTILYIHDSRNNGINGRRHWHILRKIWWILCILLTLWLLVQYWIVIPYEIEDIIGECCASRWWKLFHFDYDFASSVYRQWWSWVAFIDYEAEDLIFDFFVLLFVSLQRCNFIQHDVDAKQPPQLRQRLTLTKRMKETSDSDEAADYLWESFKLQCLIYSDKVLLLLMFIFGIMNVDLLSIVFLLFPFFELFFTDSTDRQQLLYWWHYVQVYNVIVLTIFIIYQLPAIPTEDVEWPFIPWQNILGVYKIHSNGDGYCYDKPCINIFKNSSIIHNIILLIIIDLQIKILTSRAYEKNVIATYREWTLFSAYRCFHSALMIKFKRLSKIDFYQNEKQIVKRQLEELFADPKLEKDLKFEDQELTYYPQLEGENRDKEEEEKMLYQRSMKSQFSQRDPNWSTVNQYNKDDIDVMENDSSDDDDEDMEEKKHEMEAADDREEGEEKDEEAEKLFVPYEEGLFMLMDKDFYVINTMAPNEERKVKIMEFFDGGEEINWGRYLRHLYKGKTDEAFVAQWIVSSEEVVEPALDENGNEIEKRYTKQYTENVAIMLKEATAAREFDSKTIIADDAIACVVLLPECSKFEEVKFKIGKGLSNLWIKIRMWMIASVDTSMYCNTLDVMQNVADIGTQLDAVDANQLNQETKCKSGELRAYYDSQKRLLKNVPLPNKEDLEFYKELQKFYKEREETKRTHRADKTAAKHDKKRKQQVQKVAIASAVSASTSASSSPSKHVQFEDTVTPPQETYFDRRRRSVLSARKSKLLNKLEHLKTKSGMPQIDLSELEHVAQCGNLLEMAVEIQSDTLEYLASLHWMSLFGSVILSHTQELSVLCFFVTLFANATILYSIVPISFLIYGLLQLPRADQQFWLWIAAYTQIVMVLKFLYQLDIFCMAQYVDVATQKTSYYYNIQSDYACVNLNPGKVRWDQILGITKSEYEQDAVSVLIADIVCLIFVAIHIMMLKKRGVWYQTENDYDDYIGLWFTQYQTRQFMYLELEKTPAHNQKALQFAKNIVQIKRIGEPQRIYDCDADSFIENDIDYQWYAIHEYRRQYVGIATWDWLMYKFHATMEKCLPFEVRKYFFELIPPSFRLLNNSESICDEQKPGKDLYFKIFVVDMILLFWVLLFYQAMAEQQAISIDGVGFSTSRFSGNMVFILFIQICFMIMDRIVYLTNTLVLKLICQFISVVLFHYLIFVDWPQNTNTLFSDNGALVMYYLLRVVYWLWSCEQIAHGYPTFTRSHSRMSKDFTFTYWCFFIVYMAIPFVYEMRTILEWVCIPTTLQLFELLKVEEIYGQLFKTKCVNIMYMEQRNRGQPILMFRKFFAGGCVFIAIVCFLVIPLLLFSTASPASATNPVSASRLSISIINIQGFGTLDLLSLSNFGIQTVQTPIDLRPYFEASSQISQQIYYESDADSIFTVPTTLSDRVSQILGCENMTHSLTPGDCEEQLSGTQIQMTYEFTRAGPDDNNPIEGIVYLNTEDLTRDQAKQLSYVLNSSIAEETKSFVCPSPYHEWLRLQAQHDVITYALDKNPQRNMTLQLNTQQYESYWNVEPAPTFILISDNFVSSTWLALAGVSSYSVIGFYAIVVYSFAQLLRLMYGDQVKQIIFTDLQCVDYILRIVTAVKLARTQRNYHLEELLYRKLIRIYRDPALLVQLTKRLDTVDNNAFDGLPDTSYNNPNNAQWGIRNRKEKILKQLQQQHKDDDDDDDEPTIASTISAVKQD
eukprot:818713_1